MSREPFTERWARLRAEAKAKPATKPASGAPTAPQASPDMAMDRPDQKPQPGTEGPAKPPAASPPDVAAPLDADALAALPPLESLTEQSDLRPFLRAGVPAALRNAAMRRMWLLNPTIRDHADCAVDYAWDWNTPGGVPGNGGRLSAASAKRMMEALGAPQKTPAPGTAAPRITTPDPAAPPPSSDGPATPEEADASAPQASDTAPLPAPATEAAASAAKPRADDAAPRPERPRHGGARPR